MTFLGLDGHTWGYIAAITAAVFWGTQSIPFKSKRIQDTNVNPLFVFTAWGLLSALLWVLTNVFWNYAIRLLGLGAAAGLGSGLTMAVSFTWGATVFGKPLHSVAGALCALVVLFVGIAFVALAYTDRIQRILRHFSFLSKSAAPATPTTSVHDEHRSPDSDHHQVELHEEHSEEHHDEIDLSRAIDTTSVPLTPSGRRKQVPKQVPGVRCPQLMDFCTHMEQRTREKILGVVLIVLAGLVNGSSLVPLQYAPKEAQGIQYMCSFGIGVLVCTPCLNLIYWSIKREKPDLKYKIWQVPTFAAISGVMWNVGNFSGVYATLLLGYTIGFPLTQLSLVVSALWGILLFKEVTGRFELIAYFLGVVLIVAGAFMLGNFA